MNGEQPCIASHHAAAYAPHASSSVRAVAASVALFAASALALEDALDALDDAAALAAAPPAGASSLVLHAQ